MSLDPHARPPDNVRAVYKRYQKMKLPELDRDEFVLDFTKGLAKEQQDKLKLVYQYNSEELYQILQPFSEGEIEEHLERSAIPDSVPVYEHEDCPGLRVIPSLLPPSVQRTLLSRVLHRDLSNPSHNTNVHLHHHVSYPEPPRPSSPSFFSLHPTNTPALKPRDPSTHRPIPYASFLRRKLRWLTLGGQYDWTLKRYPADSPPFPADIGALLGALVAPHSAMQPEAAIANFYSPGDTLSVHRDVSEECAAPLVSVSVGCEGVFVVAMGEGGGGGPERGAAGEEEGVLAVRLRSGDVVVMSGEARFAWHGVPLVVAGTCPEDVAEWPARAAAVDGAVEGRGAARDEGAYEPWRGWMRDKRVNLNVRQMHGERS